MSNIFKNLEKNDKLSLLRGLDLQELLNEVENYYLTYRDTLGLPSYFTFGVEIEYEGISKILTDKFIKNKFPSWKSTSDGSLSSGGEIISPVMNDELNYWKQLKKICDHLTLRGADTTNKAGGHIHVGINAFEDDVEIWKIFLKLYTAYESVIFRFSCGDKLNARKSIETYAYPISERLHNLFPRIDECLSMQSLYHTLPSFHKYQSINFRNMSNLCSKITIEFRGPNGTTNPVIWQNNINAFTKMIKSSKTKEIDTEFLDYKLNNEFISYSNNKYLFECISLKNVLEFVDLVFDNNLDKIYFLRQYFKCFEEIYNSDKVLKSKVFVK